MSQRLQNGFGTKSVKLVPLLVCVYPSSTLINLHTLLNKHLIQLLLPSVELPWLKFRHRVSVAVGFIL